MPRDVRVREYSRWVDVAKREEAARQHAFVASQVGPEELENLQRKLFPGRFPGMSPRMAAIVGYILEKKWTSPQIDEMAVTSDGFVMASHTGEIGMNHMIGSISDLNRNWESLLDAADLTLEERGHAEHLFRVKIEQNPMPEEI